MHGRQAETDLNHKINCTFLFLLIVLLILRFPLFISIRANNLQAYDSAGVYIFRNGTYLITAIMIFIKRDSLEDYNIDLFALLIFSIAPIARVILEFLKIKNASLAIIFRTDYYFEVIVSVCLTISMLLFHPYIRRKRLKYTFLWLFIAAAVGIFFALILSKILVLQKGYGGSGHSQMTALYIVISFFDQLLNAAVLEEPLFRGFMWGFLKSVHCKEVWIWLFQAALFWLGHIYYLGTLNISFFTVPCVALVLGLLSWRSKSIGNSMIAHGLINSFGNIFANFS